MSGRPAVFVDRDGVINQLVDDPQSGMPESPLDERGVALVAGVPDALRSLSAAGFLLVGVSNQPAAAKGKVPVAQIEAVQRRVLTLLETAGVEFAGFRICLHHPHGVVAGLSGPCACRKPAPGMLLDAARELDIDLAASWMIGDTDADVAAGRAAGCRTVLIEHPGSAHKRGSDTRAGLTVTTLGEASCLIIDAIP